MIRYGLALTITAAALVSWVWSVDDASSPEWFEKKIRPVLAEKCYSCHSATGKKLKGSLQVDHREHLLTGGDTGPAILGTDIEQSLLIEAIRYDNPDLEMPPSEELSDEVVADFEAWVAAGSPWPDEPVPVRGEKPGEEKFDLWKRHSEHWSWRSIDPGVVPHSDSESHPIDAYIHEALAEAGLRFAKPAEKRSWLRRVTFDLIGLPPTPHEIEAFLADETETARAKVVDRLLASPHFGEKWARHWMDLMRYAETYGHEFDYPIDYAHEYRDYLIRAFNLDLPYDQLIREHVAGDLIEDPRRHLTNGYAESPLATGFWYLHEATHAPTDVLSDEADHMDNQIDVFGKAFLGLTISCARCHDHKFDAISTADYYALTSYLHGSARAETAIDVDGQRQSTARFQRDSLTELEKDFSSPSISSIEPYADAALRLLEANRANIGPSLTDSETVIADFESGWGDWQESGSAFKGEPLDRAVGNQKPLAGHVGSRVANSYATGSDRATGELHSPRFEIEASFLNFRVGGGRGEKTAVELWVDGERVERAYGENSSRLVPTSWSLDAYRGRSGQIRIVDQEKGGWGHVIADHFVLSNSPIAERGTGLIPPQDEIAQFAKREGLNAELLGRWTSAIAKAEPNPADPLGLWSAKLGGKELNVEALIARSTSDRAHIVENSSLFADFGGEFLPAGWTSDGEAFELTGDTPGLSLSHISPLSIPDTIDSSLLGDERVGTLRSPTFTIDQRFVHVRLRSEEGFWRVVIDNYHMAKFNGLLFNGTIRKSESTEDRLQWRSLDLSKYQGHRAYLEFVDKGDESFVIDEVRFSNEAAPKTHFHPVLPAAAGRSHAATEHEAIASLMGQALFPLRPADQVLADNVAELRDLTQSLPRPRFAITMAEGTRENARVYVRGSHRSLGEEVPPRFLEALGGEVGDRLTLAGEVASADNPLTSRVIVNRLWHHLFGAGLVPSVDDFGPMGQQPSHPELLDWLARDFTDGGWSIKRSLREMVLSKTYGQSSLAHPEVSGDAIASVDPTNRLLHRMPVRRLTAEAIRDGILAASGRLDRSFHGPSIPTHRTAFMSGRGARGSGPLDGAGRRTIYGATYRNFLSPFLMTFDMPNPFGPKGRRSVSNVPAQSLALMNDPFVIGQAEILAERVMGESDGTEDRLNHLHELVTGNQPSAARLEVLSSFLADSETSTGADDRLRWVDLAHAMLNSKDFLFLR
ncbi:MAG: PSD1 and planctomycete cytochrome C domain-containing protein [Verrucomicrobiota bacterium]